MKDSGDPVKLAQLATQHLAPRGSERLTPEQQAKVDAATCFHPTQGHPITQERLRQIQENERRKAEAAAQAEADVAIAAAVSCDDGGDE